MIKCPKCSAASKVLQTRQTMSSLRRRRQCLKCRARWTTFENTVDLAGRIAKLEESLARTRKILRDLETEIFEQTNAMRGVAQSMQEAPRRHHLRGKKARRDRQPIPDILRKARRLTRDDRAWVIKNHSEIGTRAAAEKLGVHPGTISRIVKKNRLEINQQTVATNAIVE